MTFFNIIIPFYNVEKWITRCLASVDRQNYDNYRVVLVNDCSTDNTTSIIKKLIAEKSKFSLLNKEERGGALSSTYHGIEHLQPTDDEVIVILDGDDCFASPTVLSTLEQVYSSEECLITYGSYIEHPSGIRGKFSKKLPDNVIEHKLFRKSQWMTSHLRTFKYILWRNIDKEDVLDKNGKIYSMAGDLPVMFPMLEMAEERSRYVDKILYIYNRINPLNEDKINNALQLSIEAEVRNKKIYPRLEDI